MARWQSGDAAACKAAYTGSIPVLASILICQPTPIFIRRRNTQQDCSCYRAIDLIGQVRVLQARRVRSDVVNPYTLGFGRALSDRVQIGQRMTTGIRVK